MTVKSIPNIHQVNLVIQQTGFLEINCLNNAFFGYAGPLRLPILGNIIQVMLQSNMPHIAYQKLAKIYGDVMFLKLGRDEAGT